MLPSQYTPKRTPYTASAFKPLPTDSTVTLTRLMIACIISVYTFANSISGRDPAVFYHALHDCVGGSKLVAFLIMCVVSNQCGLQCMTEVAAAVRGLWTFRIPPKSVRKRLFHPWICGSMVVEKYCIKFMFWYTIFDFILLATRTGWTSPGGIGDLHLKVEKTRWHGGGPSPQSLNISDQKYCIIGQ